MRTHRIAGLKGGTSVPYTDAEEAARNAEEAAWEAATFDRAIKFINDQTTHRINKAIPAWKQSLDAIRGSTLVDKGRANWTQRDIKDWRECEKTNGIMRSFFDKSEEFKEKLSGLSNIDLRQINFIAPDPFSDDDGWPT